MTFIICPSNNIYDLYLKKIIKTKEEKQNYQRLTEISQIEGIINFNVIIIESNHQYFTFDKTVKVLDQISYLQKIKAIPPIIKIKSF